MPSLDPSALLKLGERLRSLREEGYLVIGSGFMTHSFAVFRDPRLVGHNQAFDEWAVDAMARGDVDELVDFRAKAPGHRSRTRRPTTSCPCCSPWARPPLPDRASKVLSAES